MSAVKPRPLFALKNISILALQQQLTMYSVIVTPKAKEVPFQLQI
jgi:hypothetical protein